MGNLLHRWWLGAAALGLLTAAIVALRVWAPGSFQTVSSSPEMRAGDTGQESAHQSASWAVEPNRVGPQLPPAGRSLFDHLVTSRHDGATVYDVPFPFSALVRRIEEQLRRDEQNPAPFKKVLIPLGRSLQRSAGAPEYFSYPRAIAAVDGEPRDRPGEAGMLLKDRLYLGYHEKADLIEVISYNETAGRFEFQVVKNYRAGARPEVFYANRVLCLSCHRNHAPIFSRQTWDETNAAPEVRARLEAQNNSSYDFPLEGGVDIPNAIDDATDRANLFAVSQLLWREGCEDGAGAEATLRCRAAIFTFMLQFRLSSGRFFDAASKVYMEDFLPAFAQRWRQRWPGGLAVPNPDVPNRVLDLSPIGDPRNVEPTLAELADVADRFDPLVPRPPLAVWRVTETDRRAVDHAIRGLAEFVTAADIRRLDRHLFIRGQTSPAPRRVYRAACEFGAAEAFAAPPQRTVEFRCRGSEVDLTGRLGIGAKRIPGGSIDRLAVFGNAVLESWNLASAPLEKDVDGRSSVSFSLTINRVGLQPRLADGNALETIRLWWDGDLRRGSVVSGRAEVVVLEDFTALQAALRRMVQKAAAGKGDFFSAKPFRRSVALKALYEELGMTSLQWCCDDSQAMPAAILDTPQPLPPNVKDEIARGGDSATLRFHRHCAVCHRMAEASPANFLYGDREQVATKLKHCAERIFFRLEMARLAPGQRPKSPMPPHSGGAGAPGRDRHRDMDELTQFAAAQLQAESGRPASLEDLTARGYWNLRSCLPPDDSQPRARGGGFEAVRR